MNNNEKIITKIQENDFNLNLINDIIIELSQRPNPLHFEIIDFLLDTFNNEELSKININIVYLLGELGKITSLEQKYIQYLYETFYVSDRWIRTEILKVLETNIEVVKSNSNFIQVISSALKEEYESNTIIALKIIRQLDKYPAPIFKSFLVVLNKAQSKLKETIDKVINRHFKDESLIFELLNQNNNYRILKPHGLRLILQAFFPSTNKIENFQTLIENSDWEEENKSQFLKEIDIIRNLVNRI
ncbi:MAG: hypothetical protein EU531_06060 [Promethearchaeota archaeon]|nr:MAG: hypothetical protein EU531_06060 [Candidatus Lokiarchaeota archaeon]